MDEPLEALVAFELALRSYKISVDIGGDAHDQRRRSAWRALLLVIMAKRQAVEQSIFTIEHDFLAFVVMPDGSTAGDWLQPQIELAYQSGAMPLLLLPPPAKGLR